MGTDFSILIMRIKEDDNQINERCKRKNRICIVYKLLQTGKKLSRNDLNTNGH